MEIVRVRLVDSIKGKDCALAPPLILAGLRKIKSSERGKEINFDKLRLEEIHVDLENVEEGNFLIFENAKEIFQKNEKAFFIGGDHSISYSLVRAFAKVHREPLLIVFDAGGDIGGKEGNRNWLLRLLEDGFSGSRIVLVSARNLDELEKDFLKKHRVTLLSIDVLQENREEVCDLLMERAVQSKGFYVSVDIGCVDPAFAPGVTQGKPGGLSSRELIYFIKRLSLLANFCGGDIVEVNPSRDSNEMTVNLASVLLSEMI